MRREVRLGRLFSTGEFERAFASFAELYQVRPHSVACSPDVLQRYCVLFEGSVEDAHRCELRYNGIPLVASVLPPGMIAFEGHVDEGRMGDW
ncbi:MAG: hypothetical protein M3Z07_04050 [Candidatus Eremiobacteraeota bacterium]|nr:hypothetical protein [Candidatus Eremiobacteraeota bacterium]MDQ6823648.1 hypothetical protein [Candidatus Eremiobacteraeota bacterium]